MSASIHNRLLPIDRQAGRLHPEHLSRREVVSLSGNIRFVIGLYKYQETGADKRSSVSGIQAEAITLPSVLIVIHVHVD